ncbi:hypothetical protein OF363_00120 [Mycoplasma enhydrae]|uniref:hypothetical protein n=1 Tax=Mycoplasma enhydrae TaxID=2499220 RepID=UPI0021E8FE16|nr:hypothetical protein [Mycoplasma enhydrae]MCV3733453.1 hypothetical protein [Mycoplasma enhydrae]
MKEAKEQNTSPESKTEKRKKQRKIVSSVFMFTGLIGSLVAITATAIYFSIKKTKKFNSILDSKNDITLIRIPLAGNQKKYNIKLNKEIKAKDLYNFDKSIELSKKPEHNFGINAEIKYSFYKTGYPLSQYFDVEPRIGGLEENIQNKEVLSIDILKQFNEFNKKEKNTISFEYFVQQIASAKIPISYFYTGSETNKAYFFDFKNGVSGFEIKEFFSKIHEEIKKIQHSHEFVPNKFQISIFGTTKNGVIEKLKFVAECEFSTKEPTKKG